MEILDKITSQISSVKLLLYAVTLTATTRFDTSLLLMLLHWHGFAAVVNVGCALNKNPPRANPYRE